MMTTFNCDRHLHRVGLPTPGGRHEFAEVCGDIASLPLDRDHPLWEMWVIEDIADGNAQAVLLKAHHAVVDGVAGASLVAQLCSQTSPTRRHRTRTRRSAATGHQKADQDHLGLMGFALRPWRLATVVPATTVDTAADVFSAPAGGFTWPRRSPRRRPPFNAAVQPRTAMSLLPSLTCRDIKTIKNRFGVTVNDVVVALCSAVLRRFLLDRHELPEAPLVATVPVSVHDKSDRHGHNQTTWMFFRLETHISDPADRLLLIAEGNSAAKDHVAAMGPNLLHDWTQFAGQRMLGAAMKLLPLIPRPAAPVQPDPLKCAGPADPAVLPGVEVEAMYSLGPILAGSGLNITVMSLNDELGVGSSPVRAYSRTHRPGRRFRTALKELLECATATR